jgi:hypothetical protein
MSELQTTALFAGIDEPLAPVDYDTTPVSWAKVAWFTVGFTFCFLVYTVMGGLYLRDWRAGL